MDGVSVSSLITGFASGVIFFGSNVFQHALQDPAGHESRVRQEPA